MLLNKSLALYQLKYKSVIALGGFNVYTEVSLMPVFCDTCNLKIFFKESACYKNPENPSCIALTLTNRLGSLRQVSQTFIGNTITVTKMYFQKLQPIVIHFRDLSTSKMKTL